jgi:hypothetical protein
MRREAHRTGAATWTARRTRLAGGRVDGQGQIGRLGTRYAAARRSLRMGEGLPVLIRTSAGRVAATMPAA